MKKQLLAAGLCALLLFTAGGCGGNPSGSSSKAAVSANQQTGYPVTIKNFDSQGNPVETTYEKPPKRIVALWQNSIETLLQLGAEDQIIAAAGIDDPIHLTEEDRAKYEKLPLHERHVFSQEQTLSMHPDFILAWRFDFSGRANSIGTYSFWKERHVPVYMTMMDGADFLEKHRVEDELQYISDVGSIVGKKEKAAEITGRILAKLQKGENLKKQPHQKVLIVSSLQKGIHIYTPRTLPGDIVTRLGGDVIGKNLENVGHDEIISMESVITENPDVIFVQSTPEQDEMRIADVYNTPALAGISAVQNKRVYAIPFYTIRCPAVRVEDAIDLFTRGLYPEDKA